MAWGPYIGIYLLFTYSKKRHFDILRKTALEDRVKTKKNVRIVFKSPEKAKPGVGHVHSFLSTDCGKEVVPSKRPVCQRQVYPGCIPSGRGNQGK